MAAILLSLQHELLHEEHSDLLAASVLDASDDGSVVSAPHSHLMHFPFLWHVWLKIRMISTKKHTIHVRAETWILIDVMVPKYSVMYFIISKVVPGIKANLGLPRMWND